MEVLRLRKMALKSIIGFGALRHQTVKDVLSQERGRLLINIYYSLGKISFIDDILVTLGIVGDLQIQKPGKIDNMKERYELIEKACKNYYKTLPDRMKTDNERMGQASHNRKLLRIKTQIGEVRRSKTKAQQQANNHGNNIQRLKRY